jgi:hypothetical protein
MTAGIRIERHAYLDQSRIRRCARRHQLETRRRGAEDSPMPAWGWGVVEGPYVK